MATGPPPLLVPPGSESTDSLRAWAVVGAAFPALFGVWGTVFTFTVYSSALAKTFGLTAIQTSTVFSVGVGVTFAAGGFAGLFAARYPFRLVLGGAAVAMALGSWTYALAASYRGVVVGFALVGAATGTVFVLVLSVVPQWFDAYEGRAMGVTVVGSGLGVQVMPFVWLWLLDRTGFRSAFVGVGTAVTLVLVASTLVLRRPMGHDGGERLDRTWLRRFLTHRRTPLAFVGVVCMWSWYFVLSGDAVGVLTAEGVPRGVAAGAFGLVGGVSIVSRVGSGALADRLGHRPVITAGLGAATVGVVLLEFAGSRPVMYLSLVAFGVGLGALVALYPPALIRGFDPRQPSAVVGLFQFANAVAGLLVPLGVSVLVARTGGYTLPLAVLAAVTVVGAALFWLGADPSGPPVSEV